MRTCTWSRGCSATIASDDKMCAYHAKVTDGFITTTRSESGGGKGTVPIGAVKVDQSAPITLTAREREAAEERQRDYEQLLRGLGSSSEGDGL